MAAGIGRLSNGLIMGAAAMRVTEKEDEQEGIDQQDIFYRMVFFLAAITRFAQFIGDCSSPKTSIVS